MYESVGAFDQRIRALIDVSSGIKVAVVEFFLDDVSRHFRSLRNLLERCRFGDVLYGPRHRLRRFCTNFLSGFGRFLWSRMMRGGKKGWKGGRQGGRQEG